jgi:hypothetical protein
MISDRTVTVWATVAWLCWAGIAGAQQQPGAPPAAPARPKAAQAIEIRGQVPTPQVVTVRPRQIPMFSREVLTPAFFDRSFWASLLIPYEIVPNLPAVAGAASSSPTPPALPADSGHRPPAADTSGRSSGPGVPPSTSPGSSPRANAGDIAQGPTPKSLREK